MFYLGLEVEMSIYIRGTGSFQPGIKLTNKDLEKMVDTNDQWIVERTGIKSRNISDGITTVEMALEAGKRCIKDAGIDPEEVDLIIVSSVSTEMITPTCSSFIQHKLGCKNAIAFDINAACTGFVYGVANARAMLKTMNMRYAIIIGVDTLSKITDYDDRSTCVLFGDGAGAVLIEYSNEESSDNFHAYLRSDGSLARYLTGVNRLNESPFVDRKNSVDKEYLDEEMEELIKNSKYLYMDGREVFKFATKKIIEAIKTVSDMSNTSLDEVKYIVPHQANSRIIEYSARKLGLPMDRFFVNIDTMGNTSSASIPMALDDMNKQGLMSDGDKLILTGFGGGMTWGAVFVEWSKHK